MTDKEELQFWYNLKSTYMNQISEDKNTIRSRQKSIELAKTRISGNEKVLIYIESEIQKIQVENNDSDEQGSD